MRLLPILTVAALVLAATPAFACRIPQSQFVAAWREEPASAPDDLVLHGRLTLGSEFVPAASDAKVEASLDPSALYLFGTLQRRDGPPVRVYRRPFLSSCDITPPGIFEQDVWIVGRPLPDKGEGQRVELLVQRRSGVWGVE
jgi:hypothetical protein